MRQVLRGLGALVLLALLLAGIPAALVVLGGNPFGVSQSWDSVARALLGPASDRVLVGIVTVIGWLAWAGFTLCVAVEAVNTMSGRRIRLRLPGLRVGQKAAAVLIIAVVAMIATPHAGLPTAAADPLAGPAGPPGASVSAPTITTPPATVQPVGGSGHVQDGPRGGAGHGDKEKAQPGRPAADTPVVHSVQRGEYLWSLAEHYLGDGSLWYKIKAANPGITTDLAIGQKLIIPVSARHAKPAARAETVTVQAGDTLSKIADRILGSPDRWPDIYRLNRDQITDPDLIEIGQTLHLPHTTTAAGQKEHAAGEAADQRSHQQAEKRAAEQRVEQRGQDRMRHQERAGHRPGTTPAIPTRPAPQTIAPRTEAGEGQVSPAAAASVSVGLLLAAGLVTTLNLRRRRQLRARRPGRRIPAPPEDARALEAAVKAQHGPFKVDRLDQVMRAISAHCNHTGQDLPALSAVRVSDTRVDLLLSKPAPNPPAGIDLAADGSVWTLHAENIAALLAVDGIDEATAPYPALVTLGRDSDTAHILIDLEAAAALTITADTPDHATSMLATIALELAVSPWAQDLNLTLVGPVCEGFAVALDHPTVTHLDQADQALAGLEARAAAQRQHLHPGKAAGTVGQKRADPVLADAWCPQIVLFGDILTGQQAERLGRIVTDLPRVAIAAVTTSRPPLTPWHLTLAGDPPTASLAPHDWRLTPQLVTADQYRQMLTLISTTGTDQTTPAPWWDHDPNIGDRKSPATVTVLNPRHPNDRQPDVEPRETVENRETVGQQQATGAETNSPPVRRSPLSLHALIDAIPAEMAVHAEPVYIKRPADDWTETDDCALTAGEVAGADELDPGLLSETQPVHPMLRILGPPDIIGARGDRNRNPGRCMEVMLYLLEHPGPNTIRLADVLCRSRATAKSVVSYLRAWLGADGEGAQYLPDALSSGGYRLDDRVTSDWHRVQLLIGRGVNTAASEALVQALTLVRGEVLEGADDWVATEALRPDITSVMVDIAHELICRCLDSNDIRLARWAAGRGLLIHPDSEILLTDRLRTENHAGNRPEAQRLAGRIGANARALGVDLLDETTEVLRLTARH